MLIFAEALSDASKAIELCQGKGRTGCQAYCQRGMLHRKAGRNELAKDDFTAAAQLGSKFAKSLVIFKNLFLPLKIFSYITSGHQKVFKSSSIQT